MTKRRKCISTIILVLFCTLNLNAQSNTVLSQYFSTPLFYNPGSAGDNNSINIIGAGQIQHTKPTLEIKNGKASADMPLAINNHLTGIGVMADYSFTNWLLENKSRRRESINRYYTWSERHKDKTCRSKE